MIRASCLCGQVRFEATGGISHSRYCHCENCRKFSGTAQAAWGVAEASGFAVTTGAEHVRRFATEGGGRMFCGGCGSPLWYEPAAMPSVIGIPLGVVDAGEVEPPNVHLWTRSSPSWETIADDLLRHATVPDPPNPD